MGALRCLSLLLIARSSPGARNASDGRVSPEPTEVVLSVAVSLDAGRLLRNEEVGGSNPLTSTQITRR